MTTRSAISALFHRRPHRPRQIHPVRRLIQETGGLTARENEGAVLDSMDLERERGITIKAQTVRLKLHRRRRRELCAQPDGHARHVDFAYEVSRSLAACEGSILVVDASQGVEAQTLANVYQAIEHDHEIVPVLNKVDLPAAEPDPGAPADRDVIGIGRHRRGGVSPRRAWASRRAASDRSRACRRPRATRPRR